MANIIEITDLKIPELDIYARLTENQLLNREKPAKGLFFAESPKVIHRALDAGYKPVSILTEKKHIETQAKDVIARCGNIPVYTGEFDLLSSLTGYKLTRGMLCAMVRKPLCRPEDICAGTRRIAVLEDVENPTNVGAIFRSAAALNVDALLLTTNCSDPLYRRAIRVSMGTVFQIPWTYMCKSETDMDQLKNMGFKTVAMALGENSISIRDKRVAAEDKLAIILGSEGWGLSNSTISQCDYRVKIPMSHGVDSLNVAAASAVAFWQLCGEADA